MVYDKDKQPLRETSRDYITGADTFVSAFTRVHVMADRPDGMSLVRWEGTISCFQIETKLLRDVYKDVYPVKPDEDPLESREFTERSQCYLAAREKHNKLLAWEHLKDFVRHHYIRRQVEK